jgi:major membrane immunogen (membrane-anchored lipoprotein)
MKKVILSAALVAAVFITGCKKDDVTAPEVTLVGGDQTISLNSSYSDPGATASDNKDGAITPTSDGTVDVNHTGTYTITYSATDAAGNTGTATRTVTVKNDAEALAGSYLVTETINGSSSTFTQTVTASTTVNNRIEFNKFANYANNTTIYAMVTGTTITLPSQTAVSIGTAQNPPQPCDIANHTFASTSGSTTSTGFTITFTDQLAGPGSCTGAVITCTDDFDKQ